MSLALTLMTVALLAASFLHLLACMGATGDGRGHGLGHGGRGLACLRAS